jgi:hypothetical protein
MTKMKDFDGLIEREVPPSGNYLPIIDGEYKDSKDGGRKEKTTIYLETTTLKKQLTEMPGQVRNSIRQHVTQSMETETKTLKEELGKTTEILE